MKSEKKPCGTLRPTTGKIVSDADAKQLAHALHAAAVYEKIDFALTDVIRFPPNGGLRVRFIKLHRQS